MQKLVLALLVLAIDGTKAFASEYKRPSPPSPLPLAPPVPPLVPPGKWVPLIGRMQPAPGNTGEFSVSLKVRTHDGTEFVWPATVDLGSALYATPAAECREVGVVDDETCIAGKDAFEAKDPKACCRPPDDLEPTTSCYAAGAQQPALHVNVSDVGGGACYGDGPGSSSFIRYVHTTVDIFLDGAGATTPASLDAKAITVSGGFLSGTQGSGILGLCGNEFVTDQSLTAPVNKLLRAATGGQVFGLCFGQTEGGQMLLEAPAPTAASVKLALVCTDGHYCIPPIETITVAGEKVESGPSSKARTGFVAFDNGTWGSKMDGALLRALLKSLHAPLGCASEWLTRKDKAGADTYSCCSRTNSFNPSVAPSVSLTFSPGLDGVLDLPLLNYLIDLNGETCLAIVAASEVSILGAHFMKDFATTFFLEKNEVMMHPANEVCYGQPAWPTGAKMSLRAR